MDKHNQIYIPDEIKRKLIKHNRQNIEVIEICAVFADTLDFPSIKAAEFLVGIGEFIDSIPSLFTESDEEEKEVNRSYRFFYAISAGTRKNIEDEVYKRYFTDPEISFIDINIIAEYSLGNQIDDNYINDNKKRQRETITIDVESLDKTALIVNELEERIALFKELSSNLLKNKNTRYLLKKFSYNIRCLERIASNFLKTSIYMQMVPLSSIIYKYKRMVRDYCRQSDKKIKFITEGCNIQLDKRIIDNLNEPLIHIIRNCMGHGIESIKDRIDKNKPEEGVIRISCVKKSGKAVIEVYDDGKGVDIELIRAVCLAKGYYSQQVLETMSDKGLLQCLFIPGFSTSEYVNDISGRGIGLDAVKNAVLNMNGKIKVDSEFGKFTRFTLIMPETLSLVNAVFIQFSADIYAVPSKSIERIINLNKTIKLKRSTKYIKYNGQKIKLYKPQILLSKEVAGDKGKLNWQNKKMVVVLKTNDTLFAVLADKIIDNRNVVVKPFGAYLTDMQIYAGGIISSGGNITFMIDVEGLYDRIKTDEQEPC